MSKSRVKITSNFDLNKLPLTIPCPNEKCDAKITFNVSDVDAKKSVVCKSCNVTVNLKPTE